MVFEHKMQKINNFMYFSSKYSFSCGIAHVLSNVTEDVNGRLSIQTETKDQE